VSHSVGIKPTTQVGLTGKLLLLVLAIGEGVHAESALADHDVWLDRRYLCNDQMSIFFPRIVARIQNLESSNLDHEHRGAEDVTGVIGRETQTARDDNVLVIINGYGRLPRGLHVGLAVQPPRGVGVLVADGERGRSGGPTYFIRTVSIMVSP
jgi:hypothetical protein